ncbi:hypothetical protein SDC9_196381 [bioreactor metagenome]|uniref:Uncharacterized protein n=1 Tax=bioreactor metagenome TaxID=1076179 RepID=A0A645IE94_9ZZZZ
MYCNELRQDWRFADHDIIGQNDAEEVIPTKRFAAMHRVPQPQGFRLTRKDDLLSFGDVADFRQKILLPTLTKHRFQLPGAVEIIFHRSFRPPGNDDDIRAPRRNGLLDAVCDDRPIYEGKHFFRRFLGRRKETRSQSGRGEKTFSDGRFQIESMFVHSLKNLPVG